ncbi:Monosaccharide-transporting ATPase [Desulfocurvibacter africanus subsp. africanus str. Walvis Bay]|uniref:Monosaccharide-transporting ATPase n=3 Tax=Desulfocurvibacter africanus TaxID=873 RepID=F3YYF4_DESAF|nr:ABC transporter ATP-binding protein [Desulfocurvibacter africanus]EGJ49598.1 Monosaccharide-transporting ATPase [Desulfocurvibacter africanus subsp. africanus str. Walvis Bay]
MIDKLKEKIFYARAKARKERTAHFREGLEHNPLVPKVFVPESFAAVGAPMGEPAGMRDGHPVVRLEGISKSFGKVKANQDISLEVYPGQILALLGENGAGKSTLMSILAGRYQPDSGTIHIAGEPVRFTSSRDAIAAGIGMVYQHFMLVETMSVAQNVLLGQEGGFILNPTEMEERVGRLAERYSLALDPAARVGTLSMGERQRVEILKLLYRDSRVLIFDEPTAVLTPPEVAQLFPALRAMANAGKAIVFISHKLEEVLSLADDVAVLRRGRIVDKVSVKDVSSKADLANRMVGKEVLLEVDKQPVEVGEVLLEIEGLSGHGLKDIDLRVRRGEIVAIVGVAGNGQKALAEVLAGLREPLAGSVNLLGKPWKKFFSRASWRRTVSYVPEDRQGLATVKDLNLVDNVLLTTRRGFTSGPFLRKGRAAKVTDWLIRNFNVQPGDAAAQAGQLSGGNLQKLVLAREFYREPQLIIAEQPSQGLDVGATEEVWRQILSARNNAGLLLITGDLGEALQLADRVAVMFEGRFMGVFPVSDQERVDKIGLMMAGVKD